LQEQRQAKRAGLSARIAQAVATIQTEPHEPWVVWCELNDEADAITRLLPGAVQIAGRDTLEDKEQRLIDFCTGAARILVTKPSIAGWGINLQHCARVCFVGMNNSFESWYQAIRRCWRFGQTRAVQVHFFYLDIETPILRAMARKEADAARMQTLMTAQVLEQSAYRHRTTPYAPAQPMQIPDWLAIQAEGALYAPRD